MQVRALNHVNIRTERLAETVAFYTEVLGMTSRPPPGLSDTSRGTWICDEEDRPVIHIGSAASRYPTDGILGSSGEGARGGGAIHHVALECLGYDELLARLKAADLTVATNEVAMADLRQIFVEDPNGVTLELNFRGAA